MSGVSSGTQPKRREKFKKNAKKVLSMKKERTCQKMEFVYSNVEEKTMAESATEKKT